MTLTLYIQICLLLAVFDTIATFLTAFYLECPVMAIRLKAKNGFIGFATAVVFAPLVFLGFVIYWIARIGLYMTGKSNSEINFLVGNWLKNNAK